MPQIQKKFYHPLLPIRSSPFVLLEEIMKV